MINIFEIYDCEFNKLYNHVHCCTDKDLGRAVTRALIGGLNIHIFMLCPTNFF